jgi:hypothetical protein
MRMHAINVYYAKHNRALSVKRAAIAAHHRRVALANRRKLHAFKKMVARNNAHSRRVYHARLAHHRRLVAAHRR